MMKDYKFGNYQAGKNFLEINGVFELLDGSEIIPINPSFDYPKNPGLIPFAFLREDGRINFNRDKYQNPFIAEQIGRLTGILESLSSESNFID